MNLHVEHDAAALAVMMGRPAPACASVVLRLGRPDDVLGARLDGNPLDASGERDPWVFDPTLPGRLLLSWSGSLGASLDDADPRNWMRPGQDAFRAFCDQVRPALEREERVLCVQPHASHVLSDAHGAAAFLRERAGQPFGVVLAPASMLVPSMLPALDDHLTRLFETLGPVATVVALEDVTPSGADDAPLATAPLGGGVMPRDLVRALLDRHVPSSTPIVLRSRELDRQLAWLGGSVGTS